MRSRDRQDVYVSGVKSRKARIVRTVVAVVVLINVTVISYHLSSVPAGQELPKSVARTMREVCPRRRLLQDLASNVTFEATKTYLSDEKFPGLQTFFQVKTPESAWQPGTVNLNVLYTLNTEGVPKLRGAVEEPLMALFQRLRHPKANFWKYQLNRIWPKNATAQSDLGTKDAHADQWVVRDESSTCRLLAFQTSILYVAVPQSMKGGELHIYRRGANVATSRPFMTVTPSQNLLIKFQGDLPHQVQDFVAEDVSPRVSIALEQFYIPDELYQHAVEFDTIRPPGS